MLYVGEPGLQVEEEVEKYVDITKIPESWNREFNRYVELSRSLENQCKYYEEEIKMLHNRIDALKIALINIVTHAVK